MSGSTGWGRVGQYLGLIHADDVRPQRGGRRSRYGMVSPRLDEDVDDLRARLDALERRLDP